MLNRSFALAAVTSFVLTACSIPRVSADERKIPLEKLKLPAGFGIELVARVPNARALSLSPDGTLFVGSRGLGKVHAVSLRDSAGKNVARPKVIQIAEKLEMPTGVAFWKGDLYVAAISKILKFPRIESNLANPPKPILVTDKFPSEEHHGWKHIAFGPDGKLYVPVGAPCNVCDEDAKDFSTLRRINADGTGMEVVARGIRNTVGFDWHPKTRELWFTDNGRDWMGDDEPACELNRLEKVGSHFGFPYCHAGTIPDPEHGKKRKCSEFVSPVAKFTAHSAPLGMEFGAKTKFPLRYRNGVFVALHGSWNRSKKSGYQVVFVPLDGSKVAGAPEPFVEGFVENEKAWGRPVDFEVDSDGSLLFSDDEAGAIYRVRAKS